VYILLRSELFQFWGHDAKSEAPLEGFARSIPSCKYPSGEPSTEQIRWVKFFPKKKICTNFLSDFTQWVMSSSLFVIYIITFSVTEYTTMNGCTLSWIVRDVEGRVHGVSSRYLSEGTKEKQENPQPWESVSRRRFEVDTFPNQVCSFTAGDSLVSNIIKKRVKLYILTSLSFIIKYFKILCLSSLVGQLIACTSLESAFQYLLVSLAPFSPQV
jgi:hypothetical protein